MRETIYYWKCDRPSALHRIEQSEEVLSESDIQPELARLLSDPFPNLRALVSAGGQGNHRTYLLESGTDRAFVRVEDGPEQDGHLAMESQVMKEVAKTGVPVPKVLFTDASRIKVPFAVQVIEYFDCPDLNTLHRAGSLPIEHIAREIGRGIARWQDVPVSGFGPFDAKASAATGLLTGYHRNYARYFQLHLERHLARLITQEFLSPSEAAGINRVLTENADLMDLPRGCLVHKDVALWNIMGTDDGIQAFIDWDDAISGDPTDDLSLLACFHPANVVQAAITGYASVRPLPENFAPRFWLHLLRNMIVKAVIRCDAGYFSQTAGGAFLMAPDQDGAAFQAATRDKLFLASHSLDLSHPLTNL